MKRLFWFVFVGAIVLMTTMGCGTIKGLGQDIGSVGGWMSRGSDSVKTNAGK